MDSYINIISVAISIGGLVAAIWKAPRRDVVMAVVLSALLVLSVLKFDEQRRYTATLLKTETNIEALLRDHERTVDQLHDELHYVSFTILTQALYRAVDAARVTQRIIELKNSDGSVLRVRVYGVTPR